MYTVFLTGGIGSGKSAVARLMRERGACVVDTDVLAHEVLAEPPVMLELARRFGDDVLVRPAGLGGGCAGVDRALLAARAFASPEGTAALNVVTHPRIFARLGQRLDAMRRARECAVAVVEIPLIEASGSVELALADEIVAVACPRELRRLRAQGRGMDGGDFDERDARQASDEQRAALADTVILNDGDEATLAASVGTWWDARACIGWRDRAGEDGALFAAAPRVAGDGAAVGAPAQVATCTAETSAPKHPVVAFVGRHNSGKTTLVEKVIAALVVDGVDVGSVKHHGHVGFDIDVPGKDSWRHRAAGASEVAVCSPDRFALIRELDGPLEVDAIAAMMRPHDIVIVEGFRHSGVPTVEVMRAANERDVAAARAFAASAAAGEPCCLDPSLGPDADRVPDGLTVGVASDIPEALEAARSLGLAAFDINDATSIAAWLEQEYVRR